MAGALVPVWANPSFIAERGLARGIGGILARLGIDTSQRWVDVGCGMRPYEVFFPAGTYVGIDVPASGRPDELKHPDLLYDGKRLPFADSALNGILSTQVLEHVPDPDVFLAECRRVLKPGAKLVLSAPFLWSEHEQPHDYFRFTSFGMGRLLAKHGFAPIKSVKSTGALEAFAQLVSTYVANSFRLPIPGFGRLLTLFVCCPVQLAGLLLQKVLPDQGELFLDVVVLAEKRP